MPFSACRIPAQHQLSHKRNFHSWVDFHLTVTFMIRVALRVGECSALLDIGQQSTFGCLVGFPMILCKGIRDLSKLVSGLNESSKCLRLSKQGIPKTQVRTYNGLVRCEKSYVAALIQSLDRSPRLEMVSVKRPHRALQKQRRRFFSLTQSNFSPVTAGNLQGFFQRFFGIRYDRWLHSTANKIASCPYGFLHIRTFPTVHEV